MSFDLFMTGILSLYWNIVNINIDINFDFYSNSIIFLLTGNTVTRTNITTIILTITRHKLTRNGLRNGMV